MAEDLCISNGSKAEKYQTLLPQIKSLIEGENDLIANLANISAALKETFGFFWVGFYLVNPLYRLSKHISHAYSPSTTSCSLWANCPSIQ